MRVFFFVVGLLGKIFPVQKLQASRKRKVPPDDSYPLF